MIYDPGKEGNNVLLYIHIHLITTQLKTRTTTNSLTYTFLILSFFLHLQRVVLQHPSGNHGQWDGQSRTVFGYHDGNQHAHASGTHGCHPIGDQPQPIGTRSFCTQVPNTGEEITPSQNIKHWNLRVSMARDLGEASWLWSWRSSLAVAFFVVFCFWGGVEGV